jgi:lysozyme family protein
MFRRLWNRVKMFFRKKSPPTPRPSVEAGEFTPRVYRDHYSRLWSTMRVKPEKKSVVTWYVKKIKEGEARYKEVSKVSGVPWEVIGCFHLMEGAGDWSRVLHNGESLKSVNRFGTRLVPRGRGKGLNWDWEEAAIDALAIKKQPKEWTIVNALYYCERNNGLGYLRDPRKPHSPYLWSFSNHYKKGKYTYDGYYDANAVSKQCGVALVLKELGFDYN